MKRNSISQSRNRTPIPKAFGLLVLGVALVTSALALPPDFLARPPAFKKPFYVYKDFGAPENRGAPSGWMGDYRDLSVDMNCTTNPRSGASCIVFRYSARGSRYANMAGVIWQLPANNGGDVDGGINLTGARKVTFWARSDADDTLVSAFTFGGTLGLYPDTDKATLHDVILTTNWTPYEIDLAGCDLTYISSFFGWVASRFENQDGLTLYLDDIMIE
jgi:hypothetical protein